MNGHITNCPFLKIFLTTELSSSYISQESKSISINCKIKIVAGFIKGFIYLLIGLLGLSIFSCSSKPDTNGNALAEAALSLTEHRVTYDPSYVKISYPNGDVPSSTGVCADVVIRAYRLTGIDLQQLVHEDMHDNFEAYPNNWGLRKTDTNIDHRRVPNLKKFFERKNAALPITHNTADYLPGDIVSWRINNGLPHIGIVVGSDYIVHNIGYGQVAEPRLFDFEITGHFRY
jgi:uncharacterized protein YijF (DUF1287 family)